MRFPLPGSAGRAAVAAVSAVLVAASTVLAPQATGAQTVPAAAAPATNPAFTTMWVADNGMAEAVPFAEEHGLSINWLFDVSASVPWDLLRSAQADGVRVNVSPLVAGKPGQGGYYATETTEDGAADLLAFLDRWEKEGLDPTAVIVDMEGMTPGPTAISLGLLGVEGDPAKARSTAESMLEKAPSRESFDVAKARWARFVDEAHERGWEAGISLVPMGVDGAEDGDSAFARVADMPYQDADWDFGSVQAYRSIMNGALRSLGLPDATSYLVYDYARSAQEVFDDAGVDVGITLVNADLQGPEPPYRSFDDWLDDLAASAAAGITPARTQPFVFEYMRTDGDPARWLVEAQAPVVPAVDPITEAFRGSYRKAGEYLAEADAAGPDTTPEAPPVTGSGAGAVPATPVRGAPAFTG